MNIRYFIGHSGFDTPQNREKKSFEICGKGIYRA